MISLDRFRAQMARSRPRALALLDEPDLARRLPRLPVQELFYAIKELGLSDAGELLALASPQQIQGFLDLDAWQKDQFLVERAAEWLDLLIDAGPAVLARAVSGLDGEAIALFLQKNARVIDLSVDAPPEQPEGHLYPTPDTFYLLDVLPGGEAGKRVERFVDWLYRADMDLARRVVMAARWELPSDLEEFAYRWRSGRMADLGYVDYYEALRVYEFLDPAQVKAGEGSVEEARSGDAGAGEAGRWPSLFLGALGEGGLLGRALASLDDDEVERVSSSLLSLVNRVMAADMVEPGDVEAARAALDRAAANLELGLGYLGRDRVEGAVEALRTVALGRVFRVGFSLTLKLKKAADALRKHAWIALGPKGATLLDPPLAQVLASVDAPRPRYPRALDGEEGERPFRALADVAKVARALEEASQLAETIRRGLGVEPRLLSPEALREVLPGADEITFATIAATLAANLLLERPPSLVPLAPADLPRLRELALVDGRLRPSARLAVEHGLAARLEEREHPAPPDWDKWMAAWLAHLAEALLAAPDVPPQLLVRFQKPRAGA